MHILLYGLRDISLCLSEQDKGVVGEKFQDTSLAPVSGEITINNPVLRNKLVSLHCKGDDSSIQRRKMNPTRGK